MNNYLKLKEKIKKKEKKMHLLKGKLKFNNSIM